MNESIGNFHKTDKESNSKPILKLSAYAINKKSIKWSKTAK
jgi:hypothetical protein